jgi:protease I
MQYLFEDLEVWYPKIRFEEEGATVWVVGTKANEPYKGKHGYPCKSTHAIDDVINEAFDALVLPGGCRFYCVDR